MAGNVIVCGFAGTEAPPQIRAWLRDEAVAGLILFKRNIDDLHQAAALIASCVEGTDPANSILVCVDQEGGRVARFGEPILRLPAMQTLSAAADARLTREAARVLGRQLRAIGVNLDFAPVLDVDTNPDNPVIGDRAFGRTPGAVIEHALAFADGLHAGGVLSCGKHFPGHGDTDLDSHLALPTLRHGRGRLEAVELQPFRAAVGRLPSLMTAHEMKAITDRYSIEEAGVLAIEAGCDLLLVCSDLEAAARLRETVAGEADRSGLFRARLAEACARANALRRGVLELPPAVPLEIALHSADARSVTARLQRLA